jgi:carboxylesterase
VTPILWILPFVVLVMGAMIRLRVTREIDREYAMRFPVNGDGIVEGAESFTLPGMHDRALLLLHGSGDSPQSLRYFGERLHAAGYTVHAPLLPGHGRSPRAFAAASADDYYEAARRALEELRASYKWVGLVGLSMGSALAARLALDVPDVRVLILLAPYMIPPASVRWTQRASWIWSPACPYLHGAGEASVHDPEARDASRAYGSFSPGALRALIATAEAGRRALPELTLPTLVINSERDNRIPRTTALRLLEGMRAPVEHYWVAGCGHVITVDYCKDAVVDLVLAFLARRAG